MRNRNLVTKLRILLGEATTDLPLSFTQKNNLIHEFLTDVEEVMFVNLLETGPDVVLRQNLITWVNWKLNGVDRETRVGRMKASMSLPLWTKDQQGLPTTAEVLDQGNVVSLK